MIRTLALAGPVLAMSSAAAAQHWWWPPQLETPVCPAPGVPLTVTLTGQFPDNCVPNAADAVVNGLVIDITTRREPPPTFCLAVISNWTLPVGVGSLDAGVYEVYGTHAGAAGPITAREFLGTLTVSAACGGACYANCDGSTAAPVLNVADFTCFLNRFAAGESYANCDGSTAAPVLNVADFTCFLQRFAAGCP